MPKLSQTQLIMLGCLLIALPFWLIGLWRAARAIRTDLSIRISLPKPQIAMRGQSIRLKLFFGGTLLLFSGFLAVIFFRQAVYAGVIAAGTLFLTGLFFACYFRNFTDDERQLFRGRSHGIDDDPEEMLLFTHPVWSAEHPGLFFLGLAFTAGGGVAVYLLGDPALLLLSVFGLVFLLHLWSFRQLNTLIVTNLMTAARQGLPAETSRLIRHCDVEEVSAERSLIDRLFRVWSLEISDGTEMPLRIKVKNPEEVAKVIEENRGGRDEMVEVEAFKQKR